MQDSTYTLSRLIDVPTSKVSQVRNLSVFLLGSMLGNVVVADVTFGVLVTPSRLGDSWFDKVEADKIIECTRLLFDDLVIVIEVKEVGTRHERQGLRGDGGRVCHCL